MIVPDINLLLFAYDAGAEQHESARGWWGGLVNGTESVGIPWVVTVGFVRLMPNPTVVSSSVSAPEAVDYVRDWFSHAHIMPLNPGEEHLSYFRQVLVASGGGGNLVPDAHIAALAMEYDAEVHTHNSDFARFPGIRWHNPLR